MRIQRKEMSMKRLRTIWFKGIICSLFPALCTWIGQSDILLELQKKQYIGVNINVSFFKDAFAFLGVVLTFLLLTCPLIKAELDERKYHLQRDRLIKNNKQIFLNVLSKTLGREKCGIDIRIFVPQNKWHNKIKRVINKQEPLYFEIKNMDSLADPGITSELKFEVYPRQEGLVGKCYQQRTILYDDDLENSNDTKYNLNSYQINKTSDLRFILVCPIMGRDDKIEAIVAFDSKTRIKVTENNKSALRRAILNYTQELHELVPEFFK